MPVSPTIPVTVITGFLGSGKTTYLRRLIDEGRGGRIAVIENEFGAESIDQEILSESAPATIVGMNEGCLCCTVRGDLIRLLYQLVEQLDAGALHFDRVVIETTGLADPSPVAQTFFADAGLRARYRLDGFLTLIDAVHGDAQLNAHSEARAQIAFADRVLISKVDVAGEAVGQALRRRLSSMNRTAEITVLENSPADLHGVWDLRSFGKSMGGMRYVPESAHEHTGDVGTMMFREARPLDISRVERALAALLDMYAPDLMRYKGVLSIAGDDRRLIFQGVHLMLGSSAGRPWQPNESRESVMVFIGRRLNRAVIESTLSRCAAGD